MNDILIGLFAGMVLMGSWIVLFLNYMKKHKYITLNATEKLIDRIERRAATRGRNA